MRVLLDTHIFLWLALHPAKISPTALTAIAEAPERYVSIASIWEMQIKHSRGKLPLDGSVQEAIALIAVNNDITALPITQDHIYALAHLPKHHGDPFDRMLVVQAQHENLTLVTADAKIAQYAVPTVW